MTRRLVLAAYLLVLALPIYWLVNMSFKDNEEITSSLTFWPHRPTLGHYAHIFTDPAWYGGFVNSLSYVFLNTVISVGVALPAAYAFSRYRFLGDKHLFFWLLSNLMAPPAVYAMPFSTSTPPSVCSTRSGPWRSRSACSTCRSRCGSWKASCPACRARSMKPRHSTATRSRASSCGSSSP